MVHYYLAFHRYGRELLCIHLLPIISSCSG